MGSRPLVVVTDFLTNDLSVEQEVLSGVADVVALDAHREEELVGRVENAAALMVFHNLSITAPTIARLAACQLIVRCGAGFDNVDGAAARARGIPLANVPDYGTEEVADSAIGLMLALARGIALYNSRLRRGEGPWMYTQAEPIWRLRGRVLGIIGLGRIGTATALRAKALGMDVAFYDPFVPDGRDKSLGVRRCEKLAELLRGAHVVSLHCPLTSETRHIINAQSLALLPRGAFLVNTARGGVVDTSAVAPAIASGQLAGAGIDVLTSEPPADDDPLIVAWRDPTHPAHDRLLINPHAAFYSVEGLTDMRRKGALACRRALSGEPLRNVVN